jgi:hypothetical protein
MQFLLTIIDADVLFFLHPRYLLKLFVVGIKLKGGGTVSPSSK